MSQRMYYAKQAYGDVYKGAAAKRDWGIQKKDRYGRSTTPGLDEAFGSIEGAVEKGLEKLKKSPTQDIKETSKQNQNKQNDSLKLMSQEELQGVKDKLKNTLETMQGGMGSNDPFVSPYMDQSYNKGYSYQQRSKRNLTDGFNK